MHETATEATAIALMCKAKQDQPAKAGLDVRRAVPNDSPTVVGKHHGLVGHWMWVERRGGQRRGQL